MVTLGVARHNSLAVEVEVEHSAGLEEGHRTAVVGIGLGAVVVHKMTVGKEDTLAAVGSGYEEGLRMAAAELEGMLVVEGMDCVKGPHMVAVAVVGNPGCTGLEVHILLDAAVREVADLVDTLHVARLPVHILEQVGEGHHNPAGMGRLVMGNPEEDIGSAEAAGILLSNRERVSYGWHTE